MNYMKFRKLGYGSAARTATRNVSKYMWVLQVVGQLTTDGVVSRVTPDLRFDMSVARIRCFLSHAHAADAAMYMNDQILYQEQETKAKANECT